MGYSYSDEVLADSPYLYWKLDETSGTTATDSSPNGRDGTYANGATLNQTTLIPTEGTSVDLDGTNDHVYYTLPASVTGDFSLEVWFNNDNYSNYPGLFGAWTANSNGNYGSNLQLSDTGSFDINVARNNFNFWEINVGGFGSISTGSTYHVVLTVDDTNNEVKLYINGTQAGSTQTITNQVGLGASGKKLVLGSVGAITTGGWNGRVDNFAVYTSVLSATRITAHYNAATGPTIDDLIAPIITVDAKDATVTVEANLTVNATVSNIDVNGINPTLDLGTTITVSATDININEETHVVIAGVTITVDQTTTDIEVLGHSPIISTGNDVTIPADKDDAEILLNGQSASITAEQNITITTLTTDIDIATGEVENLYPSLVFSKNPVHYYRFIEQVDATELKDYGSLPYDGAAVNIDSSDYTTGIFGDPTSESIVFNGSTTSGTEGINFFPNKILDVTSPNITLEFWFRTSSQNVPLFSVDKPNTTLLGTVYGGQTSENWRHIGLRNGYLAITWEVSSQSKVIRGPITDSYLADGKWHHVVLIKKTVGSTITYSSYVDNEITNIVMSLADLTDGSHGTQAMMAINDDSLNFIQKYDYEARLDEFAIYNYSFTAQDVNNHYIAGGGAQETTVTCTVTNIDIEGKAGIAKPATINVVKTNIGIKGNIPNLSAGGNIIIGAEVPNTTVNETNVTLSIDGSVLIGITKTNIRVRPRVNKVTTTDAFFRFIPANDQNIATLDAEEIESLEFGGLLYNQIKKLTFKLGNEDKSTCNFIISCETLSDNLIPSVKFSYDNITFTNSITIEGIGPNSITDVIYVQFDVNEIDILGTGTFLINVEQIINA